MPESGSFEVSIYEVENLKKHIEAATYLIELSIGADLKYPHWKRNEIERTALSALNRVLMDINQLAIVAKGLDKDITF